MIIPKTKKIFLLVLLLMISGVLAVINKLTSESYKTPSAQAQSSCWFSSSTGGCASGCACSTSFGCGGGSGSGGDGCGGCY